MEGFFGTLPHAESSRIACAAGRAAESLPAGLTLGGVFASPSALELDGPLATELCAPPSPPALRAGPATGADFVVALERLQTSLAAVTSAESLPHRVDALTRAAQATGAWFEVYHELYPELLSDGGGFTSDEDV